MEGLASGLYSGIVPKRSLLDELQRDKTLNFPEFDFMSQFSVANEEKINRIREASKLEETYSIPTTPKKGYRNNTKQINTNEEIHFGLTKGQELLFTPSKIKTVTTSPIKTNRNAERQCDSKQVRTDVNGFEKILNEAHDKFNGEKRFENVRYDSTSPTKPRPRQKIEEALRFPLKTNNTVRAEGLQFNEPQTPVKKPRLNSRLNFENTPENKTAFVSPSIKDSSNSMVVEQSPGTSSFQSNLSVLQTPVKKQGRFGNRQTPENVPVSKAAFISQSVKDNTFTINNVKVATEKFGVGTYLEARKISSECGHNFVENVNNKVILLKTFLPEHARNDLKVVKFMTNSIENRNKIQKLDLPCVEIYNLKTAIENRYYLVELIEYPIDFTNDNHMTQVLKFFEVCCKNEVVGDFSSNNLRVKKEFAVVNGQLVVKKETVFLIDFDEKAIKFDRSFNHRDISIQILKSWASLICKSLYKIEGGPVATKLLKEINKHLGFEDEMILDVLRQYFRVNPIDLDYDETLDPDFNIPFYQNLIKT